MQLDLDLDNSNDLKSSFNMPKFTFLREKNKIARSPCQLERPIVYLGSTAVPCEGQLNICSKSFTYFLTHCVSHSLTSTKNGNVARTEFSCIFSNIASLVLIQNDQMQQYIFLF